MTDDRNDPPDPFPTGFGSPPPSRFPPMEQTAVATPADPPSDWNQGADAHDLPTAENRLMRLGRFAFPPGEPPDDEGLAARDQRWTSRAIVFAALMLVIFNARSAQEWSRQQAPGWVTTTVQQMSDVWGAQVAQLGADQPVQGVRDAYRGFREARFPGQSPET